MGGWRARCERIVIVAALAALCSSCSMTLEDEGPAPHRDVTTAIERTRARSEKSVTERIERQTIPPDEEAARRAAAVRTSGVLGPGEAIWIQSGKTKVVHLPRPFRRVSIGNPELAGLVVLDPRTIM